MTFTLIERKTLVLSSGEFDMWKFEWMVPGEKSPKLHCFQSTVYTNPTKCSQILIFCVLDTDEVTLASHHNQNMKCVIQGTKFGLLFVCVSAK